MLIDATLRDDGLAIITLSGALAYSSAVGHLQDTVARLTTQGRRGILIDTSKVQRMNMAGLAALVELVARHPNAKIAFCNLPVKIQKMIAKSGLDRALAIFPDVETAVEDPAFKSHTLSNVRTVLLCAGTGSRVAPMTDVVPKPMLDVAGRPTLHRILDHLEQFGLHDIVLNPGHLGHQIIDYFQTTSLPDHKIMFANEGFGTSDTWQSDPIGSASTLKRLQHQNAAFQKDFLVLCGDALIDIDLADMMRQHRDSNADVTIAALTVETQDTHKYGMIETGPTGTITRFVEKPKPHQTDSRLANTGIYIFNPNVLDLIPNEVGLDIACDLLPAVMAAQGTMKTYEKPFSWIDIGCGRDYAQAIHLCLTGQAAKEQPIGYSTRTGVWTAPGAQVSPRARILGTCHVGEGARIDAGAVIQGVCSIGAGSVIEAGTVLQDCIVMPHTHVSKGAWAQSMIIHGEWAVDHRFADGTPQNCAPLHRVTPIHPNPPETELRKLA